MKLNGKMVETIDRFMTEWSSIIVNEMNDDIIEFNICDKVDVGVILPSGRVLKNKDDNAFRSINFSINKDGDIVKFRGYINTKNGLNEYFDENSVYAVPLYKKTHLTMEMLEDTVKQYDLLIKRLSAI